MFTGFVTSLFHQLSVYYEPDIWGETISLFSREEEEIIHPFKKKKQK